MRRPVVLLCVAIAGVACAVGVFVVLGRSPSLPESHLPFQFVDRTLETGLVFDHISGREGRHWTIEHTGTGMGLIDYDNDGWLDVYFVQGHFLPGSDRVEEKVPDRLFRNNGDGTFTEVTAAAGVGDTGFGQSVAVGDYNNDGWDDIFVANYDGKTLYRNDGDGTFTDVSEESGINDSPYADGYPNSCGFFDYDLDGYLDIYVNNYADYRLETHRPWITTLGITVYGGPPHHHGQQDILYHNNGDGTFSDVTVEAGVDVRWTVDLDLDTNPRAMGMAVAFPDVNNDGWPDIFVGNDTDPQFLFINNQDGTFSEHAESYGLLRSADGRWSNLMGIDYGDLNGDGVVDFVCSNFQCRPQDLYISKSAGAYQAVAEAIDLGRLTHDYLTWGTGLVDFDNDGDLDLFIAAGHVFDNADVVRNEPVPQLNLLFENRFNEGGDFADVTRLAGPGMQLVHWSRAALFGDLDNDGDIDILVAHLNARCDVLINERREGVPANNWITFDLKGTISNRNALGARLYLTAGDLKQMGDVKATYSYCSSNDRRVHFGLGKHEKVDALEIHWPSGIIETYENIPANQFVTYEEPAVPPPGTSLRTRKEKTDR